jgi:hypothetical protein
MDERNKLVAAGGTDTMIKFDTYTENLDKREKQHTPREVDDMQQSLIAAGNNWREVLHGMVQSGKVRTIEVENALNSYGERMQAEKIEDQPEYKRAMSDIERYGKPDGMNAAFFDPTTVKNLADEFHMTYSKWYLESGKTTREDRDKMAIELSNQMIERAIKARTIPPLGRNAPQPAGASSTQGLEQRKRELEGKK